MALTLHLARHGQLETEEADRFIRARSFRETQQDFEAELTTRNPFSKCNLSMGQTVVCTRFSHFYEAT
jgi:hypothetical protein